MAQISFKNTEKISKKRITVQPLIRSSYSFFKVDSKYFFQIDTYGKNTRKDKGKISQTIQFDKENAIELIKLLKKLFDI